MGWFDNIGDIFKQAADLVNQQQSPDNLNWPDSSGNDYPPIPPFSTEGFADDSPHPFDPVGSWGSYPIDTPSLWGGGGNSGDSGFYSSSGYDLKDPYYNVNPNPAVPYLPQLTPDPATVDRTVWGPPDFGANDYSNYWSGLKVHNLTYENVPSVQQHDTYGNGWVYQDGQWVLSAPNENSYSW